ncbi:non-ribosomal peptide synthetase [Nocardioides sp. GXZ039]|uniref:non-ribosomal peptide synthetase n=1 Tax=Nocardioides sp. GXZ039 TaxID=3136018 RepID=UPI0030F41F04
MSAPAPATDIQRQLWLADRLVADASYTVGISWRLVGEVDADALAAALEAVQARHPATRTTLREHDGDLRQFVLTEAPPVTWVDLDDDAEVAQVRARFGSRALDLESGPVSAVEVVRSPNETELHLVVHHALADETSLSIWLADLMAFYRHLSAGTALTLEEPSTTLAAIGTAQTEPRHRRRVEEALEFWESELADAPAALDLPRPRTLPPEDEPVGYLRAEISPAAGDSVAKLRERGFTTFHCVTAAIGLALARYSTQDDVVIGTPISGRLTAPLQGVMGMFANTTPLRLRPTPSRTLLDYLSATRDSVFDAVDFGSVSLEQVVDRVRPPRTGRHPLFQVMLAYNLEQPADGHDGLRAVPVYLPPAGARFELTLFVIERPDRTLVIRSDYQTDAVDPGVVEGIVASVDRALAMLAEHLDTPIVDLPWFTEHERLQLTVGGIDLRPEFGALAPVTEAVADRIATQPDRIAVIEADHREVTYAELGRRAAAVRDVLDRHGLGPGDTVAVERPDGADALAAMLAVMGSGAAWMPIDPHAPAARRELLLTLAGARAVVGSGDDITLLPTDSGPALEVHPDQRLPDPGGIAYVYFTSGSTGAPKPVAVTHRSLSNLTEGFVAAHSFTADDVVLALPPLTFDAALGDVFPVLCSGGTVVFHDDPAALDVAALFALCRRHRVTAVDAPSALWQQWCVDLSTRCAPLPATLRRMMVGGEAVPAEHLRLWLEGTDARVTLYNHYGPTETTVCATVHEVAERVVDDELGEQGLTIGRALPNVACYVLDPQLNPVPAGVPGELVIGGAGVAAGYLGIADDSPGSPFVPDPYLPRWLESSGQAGRGDFPAGPDARMYRTGDFVVRAADGRLHFLGRRDQQVKILGRRIELGEVEAALAAHDAVARSVVTAPPDATGQRRLVAYVQPGPAADGLDADVLRDHLADRLPRHMIPTSIVVIEELPLTSRGKVDLDALPSPESTDGRRVRFVEPRTQTERDLARLWSEELGGAQVGRHDRFDELGGTSLSAARLGGRIGAFFETRISPRDLLDGSDLAQVASTIEAGRTDTDAAHGAAHDAALSGGPDAAAEAVEALARADLRLLDDVPVARTRRAPGTGGPRVLLTGATGFLGAHLVHALDRAGAGSVRLLVRAGDESDAAERVATQLRSLDLPAAPDSSEYRVGDLAAETGDLAISWGDALADVDIVLNVGGLVSTESDYPGHRGANVLGPARAMREAARHGIAVHHVSTLGVFWSPSFGDSAHAVLEADRPDRGFPSGGYNQSKWVSDVLAVELGARGLPVTVHRPARLTAAWGNRSVAHGTWWGGMLGACLELGLAPDLGWAEDQLPVDWAAEAMARAVLGDDERPVWHYWSGDTLTYAEIADELSTPSAPVELVGYARWYHALRDAVAAGGVTDFAPFAGGFPPPGSAVGGRPAFDASESMAGFAALGTPALPGALDLLRRERALLAQNLATVGAPPVRKESR